MKNEVKAASKARRKANEAIVEVKALTPKQSVLVGEWPPPRSWRLPARTALADHLASLQKPLPHGYLKRSGQLIDAWFPRARRAAIELIPPSGHQPQAHQRSLRCRDDIWARVVGFPIPPLIFDVAADEAPAPAQKTLH